MFFALAAQSASLLGGWKEVKTDSEFVETVRPYINENYLKMLPEYKKRNTLLAIESAEIQVVNGYNIHIVAKLGFDAVDFTLHVSPKKEIKISNFGLAPSNDEELTMMGGWRIRNGDFEEQFLKESIDAYRKTNGLKAEISKVFLVRTQVVAGLNIHIVYQDTEGITHSVMIYRTLSGLYEIQSSDSF